MQFLTLKPKIFGLDINDLSLKIINLKKRRGVFNLASFNKVEIEPGIIEEGVIQNEEALVKIIKTALKTVKGKKLKTKYVVVSLPEEKSFLQIIQMPRMKEEELKSALLFEAGNYIPLSVDDVYLDFQIITPFKDGFKNLDVLIIAMPKKIVDSYVSCLKKAGLIPCALEIESQAITRALVKNETSPCPLVLIDFGGSNADFVVFCGNSIRFTCSIPISSRQLTTAISQSLGVDFNEAEKLKMQYDLRGKEKDKKSKEISDAINSILDDLAEQIKKYLKFYQEHMFYEHLEPNTKIEKIFLCGGGANLKGLSEFLSKKLDIPTELGNPWINFPSKKENKSLPTVYKNSLSFTTAIGLALRDPDNK